MSSVGTRTGRCLCGAVRFRAEDVPDHFGVCHCEMCRRWAGSALFGISIPAEAMVLEGEEHIQRIQSSAWAERAWCGRCGSGLWYRVTAEGGPGHGLYEVPLGLLDDTTGIHVSREIFIDEKPEGYALDGGHERLTRARVLEMYGVDL